MFRVRTMDAALQRSLAQRATHSWLLGIFAAMRSSSRAERGHRAGGTTDNTDYTGHG